jgi:hypothetical protein
MEQRGTLRHSDEALQFIAQVEDPVTRNLLNMAFVRFVQRSLLQRCEAPQADVDMLYVVKVLKDFFSEHEVIARTLAGEKVGAWFEEP